MARDFFEIFSSLPFHQYYNCSHPDLGHISQWLSQEASIKGYIIVWHYGAKRSADPL